MHISDSVKYVGVDDHKVDLFEGQFEVPNGMSYNSYVILDEKTAVMDSVDEDFGDEWISNIKQAVGGRSPDYLVVQHMEMDHSANIKKFMDTFKDAKIVSSKMAFTMMKNYFGTDFAERQVVVAENSKLELGKHTLSFIAAPNVHWPEVVMSYESSEGILFSADGFGKFGALDSEGDAAIEKWKDEARRYYFGIVGKFGSNVQAVLKKAAKLKIERICPLHGPVLSGDVSAYVSLYDIWSKYESEEDGVLVAYTSVYGNTKKAALRLSEKLSEKGQKVVVHDLARDDIYECLSDAFRFSKIVFASTTYNGDVFPAMRDFLFKLAERNLQNKTVAFIENGSWSPMAEKKMASILALCSGISIIEDKVSLRISMKEENLAQMEKVVEALSK